MNPDDDRPRERGRRLRGKSTTAEQQLWQHLRAKRFAGFKFRRQHPTGDYFADFCCLKRRLIIELDGGQHAEQAQKEKDAARTAYLNQQGYEVMRFWNEPINAAIDDVLAAIYAALTDS